MVTFKDLEKVRRGLETFIQKSIAQMFGYTLVASSSSIGDTDAAEKADDGTDPDGSKGERPVVRIQSWGFNGRPPKGVRGLWLRFGAGNVYFLGLAPQQKYGPQDLDVGETAVFNITAALLRLWKTGKFSIDSDVGQGQDVVVNGGTLKVARDSDPVNVGTLAGTAPVGGGAVTFTFTPTNADGSPGTPVAGATVTIAAVISNAGGAAHFKG